MKLFHFFKDEEITEDNSLARIHGSLEEFIRILEEEECHDRECCEHIKS